MESDPETSKSRCEPLTCLHSRRHSAEMASSQQPSPTQPSDFLETPTKELTPRQQRSVHRFLLFAVTERVSCSCVTFGLHANEDREARPCLMNSSPHSLLEERGEHAGEKGLPGSVELMHVHRSFWRRNTVFHIKEKW